MLRRALLKLMISGALLLGAHSAYAENRLALVIGQSAYRSVPALPNPANDAKAVTQLLTDSGFEVSTASDLSQSQMRSRSADQATPTAPPLAPAVVQPAPSNVTVLPASPKATSAPSVKNTK